MNTKDHPRAAAIRELVDCGWRLEKHTPREWELVRPTGVWVTSVTGRPLAAATVAAGGLVALLLRADGTAELNASFSLETLGDELILDGALDMGPRDTLPLVHTKVPFWATVPDLALVHCALSVSTELLR